MNEDAWFRKIEVEEKSGPTPAEKWFVEKAKETALPMVPVYQPGPPTYYSIIEFRNGRSQKVFLEFPHKEEFGFTLIVFYSIAWEGFDIPEGRKLLDALCGSGKTVVPSWQACRKTGGEIQLVYRRSIPFSDKLEMKDCIRELFEIATEADRAEVVVGFADVDNH